MKGTIDYVTLAIAIVPMILLTIMASVLIAEEPVRSELGAQLEYSVEQYQLHTAAAALLQDREFRTLVSGYFMGDSGRDELAQRTAELLGGQYSGYTLDIVNTEGIDIEEGGGGKPNSIELVMATPSREKLSIELRVGESE